MAKWTERQQLTIDDRGNSLLVSAAAGSGKTAVLVERIKKLLFEGASLDNMLIVTFTRAAASEMRERLRSGLNKELDTCSDERRAKLLREQLSLVGRADICTFDSFAGKIVKSYYQVIDLDPSLSICDDYKSTMLKDEAMEEMFSHYYENKDPDFLYFLDHYSDSKSDRAARDMILSLFSFADTLPDPKAYLSSPMFDPDTLLGVAAEDALSLTEDAVYFCRQIRELFIRNDMPKCAEKMNVYISDLESIEDGFASGQWEQSVVRAASYKFETLRAPKEEQTKKNAVAGEFGLLWDKGAKLSIKEIAARYSDFSVDRLWDEKERIEKPLSIICRLTREFCDRYAAKKIREGLMDFSDSEHFALNILQNEAVRNECRSKYQYIFVDEYQDSNYLQDALLDSISSGGDLFFVGDIKQSIYRFRHAEPKLFQSRYKAYKSGQPKSLAIDLNSNFRSKGRIIDFINRLFSNLMTLRSCGMEYDENAALNEGAAYCGPWNYEPAMYIADTSEEPDADPEIEELKNEELEALMAVRIIEEYKGRMFTDASGTDRPLDYKDMAILLRSAKSKGEVFYYALNAAGIPVYLERNEGYFDAPEIQVFLNLLRIIDNFSQDVPLISVLYFPVFGFTAEELAAVRIYAKEQGRFGESYSRVFRHYANTAENALSIKCREFLERLEDWRLKKDALPLADFLWQLLSESGILQFVSALVSGTQRAANLRALVDKAADYEKANAGGLFGFINFIDCVSAKSFTIKTGQTGVVAEKDNVVKIMTVHKSKGLEFPFVLLASCGGRMAGGKHRSRMVFHKELGASLCLTEPKRAAYTKTASYKLICAQQDKEELAEEIRVLYVAATRARDFLVISGVEKNASELLDKKDFFRVKASGCSNYLQMMLPYVEPSELRLLGRDSFDFSPFEKAEAREAALRKTLEEGFCIDESYSAVSAEEVSRRLSFDYRPSEAEQQKRKYSVSELAAEERDQAGVKKKTEGPSFSVPVFLSGKLQLDPAARGTAYHKVMEHIPFTLEKKTAEDIQSFIEELSGRGILSTDEASCIKPERIAAFFESDLGKRICSAEALGKESPFVIKHIKDGREVLVQGTIDCWFREGGKLFLVDYKSSYVSSSDRDRDAYMAEIAETYAPQLALYREAMEKIYREKVEASYLYLFSANTFIKMDV